ncbi:MAG TPA: hypothetical protein VEG67_02270 [Myxococcota bacterium]|nr:hypothetical protein [Myxococcota bacterium]
MADVGSARRGPAATAPAGDAKPEDFSAGQLRPDAVFGGLVESPEDRVRVPSRYRVHLLPDAKPTERGVVYRRGEDRFLLAWSRVEHALGAEVGEPEGVRTIVFDLALEVSGAECVVCRLDAEPGDEAVAVARAIQLGIGRERCSASLRAVAAEGLPTRCYSDLETLSEANLETLRFRF